MRPSVLYISYDGMLEPLGQSQVISYLELLSSEYEMRLLSYEKKCDLSNLAKVAELRARLNASGIEWLPLTYHKRPSALATAVDMIIGTVVACLQVRKHGIKLVHARSYVPSLIALTVKRLMSTKFIFDMRGFWADERIDGGLWPGNGWLYKLTKAIERRLLLGADYIVTLTNASTVELERLDYLRGRMPPLHVIPTCADLYRFSPDPRIQGRCITLGYVGSVGTWYLFDEVLLCFQALRRLRPDARLLIVNRSEQDYIRARIAHHNIPPEVVEIASAEHKDVPIYIRRMSMGAAIIKPSYSKIASAPTKVAEYLGCGIPCIGNAGVGDVEAVLERHHVGVVLRDFTNDEREAAMSKMLDMVEEPETSSRCVATARELFSLQAGADAYRSIYRKLYHD